MTGRAASLALALWMLGPACAASPADSGLRGLRVEPPRAIHGATLLDHDGRSARFPGAAGRWQLAFFGYTHCPDVCPLTLHKTRTLLDQLGTDSARMQVFFLSIDTARDNPGQVRDFVTRHDPRILGLTGEAETMQRVANEFGVLTRRYQGKTALAYTLEHSSFLYLLDPQGRVHAMYPGTVDPRDIAGDLRELWRAAAR